MGFNAAVFKVNSGAEIGFNCLFLRAGYKSDSVKESITFGFGVRSIVDGLPVSLDYAFIPVNELGMSHYFTIKVEL